MPCAPPLSSAGLVSHPTARSNRHKPLLGLETSRQKHTQSCPSSGNIRGRLRGGVLVTTIKVDMPHRREVLKIPFRAAVLRAASSTFASSRPHLSQTGLPRQLRVHQGERCSRTP